MKRIFVQIRAPREPLLIGQVAEVIWFDFVPFNETSEKNPTLGLLFPSGLELTENLSDCVLSGAHPIVA